MDCKRALEETGGDIDKAIVHLREKGMASAGKKSTRVAAEGKVEMKVTEDGRVGAIAEVNCETDFVARGDDFQSFCADLVNKVVTGGSSNPEDFEDIRKQLVAKTGENVVVRRMERFALEDGANGKVEAYQHMGGKIGVMVQVHCDSADAAGSDGFIELCRELAMHVAAANPQYRVKEDVPEDVIASEKDIYKKQAMDQGKPENIAEKMVEGRLRKWFGEFCLMEQPWVREQKMTITKLVKDTESKIGASIEVKNFVRYQLGEGIEKKKEDLAAEVQKQIDAAKGS